jgi:hypothetical protein
LSTNQSLAGEGWSLLARKGPDGGPHQDEAEGADHGELLDQGHHVAEDGYTHIRQAIDGVIAAARRTEGGS